MEYPVIVIDSTSKSDEEPDNNSKMENELELFKSYDNDILQFNSLNAPMSGNDDGDSGIHGSSEAMGPSPAPSHRNLLNRSSTVREKSSSNINRSNSATSLIERKRSFSISFERSNRNRNFSIDTGNASLIPKTSKAICGNMPYKLMIVNEVGQPVFVKPVNRESVKSFTSGMTDDKKTGSASRFKVTDDILQPNNYINKPGPSSSSVGSGIWSCFCQIHVLLVVMKLMLGVSMSVFGLFLASYSVSLRIRDCGFWAGGVLLLSGIISSYFLSQKFYFTQSRCHKFYSVATIIIALVSAVTTMTSSVYAGSHSNWITFSAHHCQLNAFQDYDYQSTKIQPITIHQVCCFSFLQSDFVDQNRRNNRVIFSHLYTQIVNNYINYSNGYFDICGCFQLNYPPHLKHYNTSNPSLIRSYVGMRCHDVFSSLKDYFVLICSLMAVASGCEIWFLCYLLKNRLLWYCEMRSPVTIDSTIVTASAKTNLLSVYDQAANEYVAKISNKSTPDMFNNELFGSVSNDTNCNEPILISPIFPHPQKPMFYINE